MLHFYSSCDSHPIRPWRRHAWPSDRWDLLRSAGSLGLLLQRLIRGNLLRLLDNRFDDLLLLRPESGGEGVVELFLLLVHS